MRFRMVISSCLLLAAAALVVGDAEEAAGPGFLLYTRRNQDTPHRIVPEVESLIRSPFYALEPVIVYIPSWQGNSSKEIAGEHLKVVSPLLQREACNVFVVDLTDSIGQSESEIVASVSDVIITLHQFFAVPLTEQQLVGFAEGAHLAGAVADQVNQLLSEQLPHITALDPTGDANGRQHQLSSRDAKLVEVVHTNGIGLGTMTQLGDVDFYPNGGQQQPGCGGTTDPDACSHERALDLAGEMWSAANDFVSAKCSTVEEMSPQNCRWSSLRMGDVETANGNALGIYFLETRSSAPYGRGAYHIGFL